MSAREIRQLTLRVQARIGSFEGARVLHIFDRSANLIDGQGEVLSIVNPEIGPGPFNLVLTEPFDFRKNVYPGSRIETGSGILRVGRFAFDPSGAALWDPVPPWRSIERPAHAGLVETILEEMRVNPVQPGIAFDPPPDPGNAAELTAYAGRLAGLGPGLTPSGDDVLVGLMHALFVLFPAGEALGLGRTITAAAAERTTSLSAAWVQAASRGEAGSLWHRLVAAAAARDDEALRRTIRLILTTGHTSGADALAGFTAGSILH